MSQSLGLAEIVNSSFYASNVIHRPLHVFGASAYHGDIWIVGFLPTGLGANVPANKAKVHGLP